MAQAEKKRTILVLANILGVAFLGLLRYKMLYPTGDVIDAQSSLDNFAYWFSIELPAFLVFFIVNVYWVYLLKRNFVDSRLREFAIFSAVIIFWLLFAVYLSMTGQLVFAGNLGKVLQLLH